MRKEKMILLDDNCIELTSVEAMYKVVEVENEDGSVYEDHQLINDDVRTKQTILKSDIIGIRQVVNEKGNVRPKRTKVLFRYNEPIIAEITYKEIQSILFENKHKNMGY